MPKLYAVQAIIFDVDGTLVDSADDLHASLDLLLDGLGLRPLDAAEIKGMIGDGVSKLVERAVVAAGGDASQKSALVARFLKIYESNAAVHTRSYPDVVETLEALRQREFRLAVVTNKPVIATEKILRALSLADYFSVVIGGDSLPQRKPDPAQMLDASRQLGVDAGQVLVVGDNIHDVEAAHAAGIRCIAVTYGYHHRPPAEFNADHLIDRFGELLSLVVNSTIPRSTTSSPGKGFPKVCSSFS
jgi:phosphoglycolate phosphatase